MNTRLGVFLADVGDKEPTLLVIWLVALALSIGSLVICRWSRWSALLAVAATGAWATAFLSELRDPDVGPAILSELGRGYVVQSYIAVFLPFVFIVLGLLPWWRSDPRKKSSFCISVTLFGCACGCLAAQGDVYSGEPLNEALYDLARANCFPVAHALVSASPLERTDVFRLSMAICLP